MYVLLWVRPILSIYEVQHSKRYHIKELNVVINGTKIDRVESFNRPQLPRFNYR